MAEPFLIAYLNGKLMPQDNRVDDEDDEKCKEAGNHTETFVH
jgi:hypothetical protein